MTEGVKTKKNVEKSQNDMLTFIAKAQNGTYCEVIPGVETLRRDDFVYVEDEDCKYSFGVRC